MQAGRWNESYFLAPNRAIRLPEPFAASFMLFSLAVGFFFCCLALLGEAGAGAGLLLLGAGAGAEAVEFDFSFLVGGSSLLAGSLLSVVAADAEGWGESSACKSREERNERNAKVHAHRNTNLAFFG